MTELLQHTVNGTIVGSVYVLIALGVTLVYGLTRLINFAHGEVVTIGALVTFWLVQNGVNYYLAILIAGVAGGVLGAALDRGVFRWTRDKPINGFLVSLGLIACSQAILIKMTQDNAKSIPSPIHGSLHLLGVVVTWQRIFVVVVAALLCVLLMMYLKLTRFGRATRAYSENPDASAMMGIDGTRVVLNIFVIGSAQAAIAGGLVVSLYAATPGLGSGMIIKAFAVALIGGLGSVEGAVLAGLLVGLSESLGAAYISSTWTDAFGYVLMLMVLMVRPTGLARGGAGAHL